APSRNTPGQLLEFRDNAMKFIDHRALEPLDPSERGHERPVVPKLISLGIEARPKGVSEASVVRNDRASVVELVRNGDAERRGRCLGKMRDVRLLAFTPWRLWLLERVRTLGNDVRHLLAELGLDLSEARLPTLVL